MLQTLTPANQYASEDFKRNSEIKSQTSMWLISASRKQKEKASAPFPYKGKQRPATTKLDHIMPAQLLEFFHFSSDKRRQTGKHAQLKNEEEKLLVIKKNRWQKVNGDKRSRSLKPILVIIAPSDHTMEIRRLKKPKTSRDKTLSSDGGIFIKNRSRFHWSHTFRRDRRDGRFQVTKHFSFSYCWKATSEKLMLSLEMHRLGSLTELDAVHRKTILWGGAEGEFWT